MKILLTLAAALALAGQAAAVDAEAHRILGKGKWALITETLSPEAAKRASACTGTSISFAFTASEIQLITFENGQPPNGPPQFFAEAKAEEDRPFTIVSLFAAQGDAKPALVFNYDPSVDTLMKMDPDRDDGTDIYVLCTG